MKEPPPIRQLPDQVANQIAAGEVVERPAAAVKELVENSLDAGATRIAVRIEDGGRRLVEVVDDGHGMRAEELELALGRHATSKLRDAEDLFRVATLGFRGEALPSIAAVSEFELASRPHAADRGAELRLAAGRILDRAPRAMPPGTRVTVRNLFWNVPARLKFLKPAASETAQVVDMVTRLALGHPGVAFTLEADGRMLLELAAAADLTARIRACLGRQVAEGLMPIAATAESLQVSGFVGHPGQARATGKRQYLWLNGRCIRDRLVVAAVREAYRGHLDGKLHAAVFLHIDTAPELVDVNVHPTKAEVRFRRDQEVFTTVRRAIRAALEADLGTDLLSDAPAEPAESPIVGRRIVKVPAPVGEPAIQERFLPQEVPVRSSAAPAPPPTGSRPSPTAATHAVPTTAVSPVLSATRSARLAEPHTAYRAEPPAAGDGREPMAPAGPKSLQIVQLRDSFLLVETEAGIRIIDQHALHEKILWLLLDPVHTDFAGSGRQELLLPQSIELSAAELAVLVPHLPRLAQVGIEAEVFGPTCLLLRAHPVLLGRIRWPHFFTELASVAAEPGRGEGIDPVELLRERIGHRRACRAAVKAGDRLSVAECQELVRLLDTLEGTTHCPHGRPTTLDLSWAELERRFQR